VATRVALDLGVRGGAGWPASEQRAFSDLAPLVALFPDLGDWSARQRSELIDLLRAKGAPRERDYLLRTQRHSRFIGSLRSAARPRRPA